MRTIFLLLLFSFTLNGLSAQTLSIKVRVINESNRRPLSNASVQLLRSSTILHTDSSGLFTLRVDSFPVTVRVTFTGYKMLERTLTHSEDKEIILALQEQSSELENVTVSTGYQQIPKERSTGSFALINEETLKMQPGSNILERLNNVTSSLVTDAAGGARPPLTIRGLSTISGPKDPLIVVDNFIYEGDISNINPNDVESVTILKDAAAASIWGARAGNGVIVIQTKKAKLSQGLTVTAGSNITIRKKPDILSTPSMNSSDFIDVEQFLFSKGFYTASENNTNRPVLSPVVETLIAVRDGKISQSAGIQRIDNLRNRDLRSQYYSEVYRPALSQQYFVNMRGGSSSIASSLSVSYDRNRSELSATNERFTLRSDNRIRVSKNISLSLNLSFAGSTDNSGQYGFGEIRLNNTQALYPYLDLNEGIDMYRKTYTDTAGSGRLLDWKLYPLQEAMLNQTKSTRNDLVLTAGAEINLIKGLRLDLRFQSEKQNGNVSTYHDVESFYSRNMINRFSQVDKATGKVTYIVPKTGILSRSNADLFSLSGRAQINFEKNFGDHLLTAIAGTEIREAKTESSSGNIYGYNDQLLTVIPVDLVNTYPLILNGSKVSIPNPVGFGYTVNRFISFYGNAAYTFKNRYTFSTSARRDASNIFGLATNDKWRPLWSAGAAWKISNEEFYHVDDLPTMKLRVSYGLSGNVDNSKSALTTISYGSVATTTNFPYAAIRQFANPSLRWEKVAMFNLGLDFEWKKILEGSVEWYRKRAMDLYGSAPIDYTGGVGLRVVKNVADMQNTGIDITLNAHLINRKFKWDIAALSSFSRTKVIKNYLTSVQGSSFVTQTNVSAVEGRPVYALYSYPWAGLDPLTGNPQTLIAGQASQDYATITGAKTTVNDMIYHGPVTPTWFGSVLNEFSFGAWSLKTMISYKAGHFYRRRSIHYGGLYSGSVGHGDFELRWKKPGDELFTSVPSMAYPNSAARDNFYTSSAALVEKADNLRLEFIRVGFDTKLFKGKNSKRVQCFAHASNLGVLWKASKNDIDPDYYDGIPPSASYTIGIQLNY